MMGWAIGLSPADQIEAVAISSAIEVFTMERALSRRFRKKTGVQSGSMEREGTTSITDITRRDEAAFHF